MKSKNRSPDEKAAASDLMLNLIILRGKLKNQKLKILYDEFDKIKPGFDKGIAVFKNKTEEINDFSKVMEIL